MLKDDDVIFLTVLLFMIIHSTDPSHIRLIKYNDYQEKSSRV